MLPDNMGGERIQVSDASKAFSQGMPNYSSVATSMPYTVSTSSSGMPMNGQAIATNPRDRPMAHGLSNDPTTRMANQTVLMGPSHGAPVHYAAHMMSAAAVMNSGMLNPATCMVCCNPQVNVMFEPCQHQFHMACVERWISKEKRCPACGIGIHNQRPLLPQYSGGVSIAMGPGPNGAYDNPMKAMMDRNAPNPTGSVLPIHPGQPSMSQSVSAPMSGSNDMPNPSTMRKGKWTPEESAYCDRLIEEFKKGNLPLAEGTTLRTFLSKLLNCDPMRISKKYTGEQCIGKIIFRKREDQLPKEDLENIRRELAELERTYLEREQYNQRRREKRLESELSRDKNRFIAARSVNFPARTHVAVPSTTNSSSHFPQNGVLPVQPAPVPVSIQPQVQDSAAMKLGQQQNQRFQPSGFQTSSTATAHSATHSRVDSRISSQGAAAIAQQLRPPPSYHNAKQTVQQQGAQVGGQPQQSAPSQGNEAKSPEVKNESDKPNHINSQGSLPVSEPESKDKKTMKSESFPSSNSDSFPRVSSIDSFSCLFPRVDSIDNFQTSGASSNALTSVVEKSESDNGTTSSKSQPCEERPGPSFPRIHSLEQISSFLQEGTSSNPAENEAGNDKCVGEGKKLSPNHGNHPGKFSESTSQIQAPKPLSKIPRNSSGIFPRVPSMDKLPRVPSLDKLPRIPSMDKLHSVSSFDKIPRVPSTDKFPRVQSFDKMSRVGSSTDMASRLGGGDHFNSFPSFSNLAGLSSCESFDKLSTLGTSVKSSFPRNSSIEDILSLVASSESAGSLSTAGSHLQLSALAAAASEAETASSDSRRKRSLEVEESGLKKARVSS